MIPVAPGALSYLDHEHRTMSACGSRINILGLLPEEILSILPDEHRIPYRARQLLAWIYVHGCTDFPAMTNLPRSLREVAADLFEAGALVGEKTTVSTNRDATKYLWRLPDGLRIESVHLVLPARETFCISSQAGCAYGCTFCATATMGLRRNLTAAEIFEQVFRMREALRARANPLPAFNVVYMGMGEPLANYDAVVDSIRRLTSPHGLGLGERRITVSTCGLANQIRKLADEGLRVGLAVSLNATTNEQRSRTMPVTRKHPIEDVLDAARSFALKTGRRVTFEYVLLQGVNDSLEDAERLQTLSATVPCKINVIPFNPFPGTALTRPDGSWIDRFLERLMQGPTPAVTVRATRGLDIAAACGQLAVSSE